MNLVIRFAAVSIHIFERLSSESGLKLTVVITRVLCICWLKKKTIDCFLT